MQIIDIGANLGHASFQQDLPQILAKAQQAGVAHIIVTGTDLESSTTALALATKHPGFLSATAGFHPHVASRCDEAALADIRALCQNPAVVAIGETGLDFNRNYSPREDQLRVFEMHLALAAELQKPMFLHQRDAHKDFLNLLSNWRPQLTGGVVHCFTDSQEALTSYLNLDMYIGITGWVCDERRGTELQRLLPQIPNNRLLIETDAPYLLPRSLQPPPTTRRNEPCYLPEILRTVAKCRDQEPDEVAVATTANARALFGLS
ncbi:MAG: TatD family hydrolase [Pseudohongiellaceae bacterium]